jgi:predicted transposase/invertase (TIGR01784 family)
MPGPHDSLVKWTFQQPQHAASELRLVLPEVLVGQLDLSQLAIEDTTCIDQDLEASYSDLLYSVPLAGQPAFVYVLFEHQSTVDWSMPLRLLEYMVRIWRRYLDGHKEARSLPFIVPVVLHHSDTGWTASRSFRSLFDGALLGQRELVALLPDFEFILDDISNASDEALLARAQAVAVQTILWTLRDARTGRRLLDHFDAWRQKVKDLHAGPGGLEALVRLMRYVLDVAEEVVGAAFQKEVIDTVGSEVEEAMATVAEALRREGEARGRREGQREGQRGVLLKQLRVRFGDVPERMLERVNSATVEQLDHWAERILTAGSIEEVLDS